MEHDQDLVFRLVSPLYIRERRNDAATAWNTVDDVIF